MCVSLASFVLVLFSCWYQMLEKIELFFNATVMQFLFFPKFHMECALWTDHVLICETMYKKTFMEYPNNVDVTSIT